MNRIDMSELIAAFRSELESSAPNMQASFAGLVQTSGALDAAAPHLEEYAGHVSRVRDTAEMLGLLGLVAACDVINESLMVVSSSPDSNWAAMSPFFEAWPTRAIAYLRAPTDAGACERFAALLAGAPAPIDSSGKGNLIELLLAVPIPNASLSADEGPARPTVATDADVSLAIPEDVDQSVFDGLMQDAPGQAEELSALIGKVAAGTATPGDLIHAKRIAHTFKGSAHIVGIKGLAHIAHHTEDILEYFEREQTQVPPAIAVVLLSVAGCLEQMTSALLGEDEPPADARDVLQSVLDWANCIDRGEFDQWESVPSEPANTEDALSFEASIDTAPALQPTVQFDSASAPADEAVPEFDLDQLLEQPLHASSAPAADDVPSGFDLDQLLTDAGFETTPPPAVVKAPKATRLAAPPVPTGQGAAPTRKVEHPTGNLETPEPTQPQSAESAGANLIAQQALRVPVKTVDELFRLTGELAIKIGQLQAFLRTATQHSRQLLAQNLTVQKRVFELENLVDVRGLAAMRTRGDKSRIGGFDPLEMDQYNELHAVTRSLAEETSDVRGLSASIEEDLAKLTAVYLQHDRIRKDLQYLTTSTRMAPVKSLLPRLIRNVKQTCQATGKKAELDVEGGDTLFDGDVLSKLADPLMHLLRNAVDHGVEPLRERGPLGKPEVARIRLSFTRQGQSVVVRCTDDGRGLDFAAIRAKAIERGLLQSDREPDERELARMILLSGFSTRDRVSEISGRGVGLDVVHNRVLSLKGTIEIRSPGSGQGTTFEMRIPASLVSVHALLVRAGRELFALPTHTIEQAFAPEAGEFVAVAGETHFKYRDRLYPTRALSELAGSPQAAEQPTAMNDYSVVLVRGDDRTIAILVEMIVDGRDLITKDMGRYVRGVRGVAGAAILGDGVIAPLLDVPEMLRARVSIGSAARPGAAAAKKVEQTRILVVDDSLGVRRSLMQLIGDSGLECQAANDGLEAVQSIDSFRPHLVITDLEMPNMNGLELTAHLRKRTDTRDLPIIMITSRSQAKHRAQAEQAGVSVYLTKPYADAELMGHVEQLVERRADELKSAA